MSFSQALRDTVHRKFMETRATLGYGGEGICERLQDCGEDERTVLEFFYSTMPASDIGDYDFSLYQKFAQFGLSTWENPFWESRIPEDIFLNYVLSYRINNEAIADCRPLFRKELAERVRGKSMKEAALEVNIWCAEHVTYQATDDRTVSPLTVMKSSYGRCGEESTFAVTALRSVGIPARQIYAPRWAHCDDNHAWVEVWCDGDWYFLGACEPEPVLNRGWFTEAAARSMLMTCKAFLPSKDEEEITRDGCTLYLNELKRYAEKRRFTVTVKNPEPLAGVAVHFELLNGSEFSPIASVTTDEAGRASVTLGFGSIHIHAEKDGRFAEVFVDTEETDSIEIDFTHAVSAEPDAQEDFVFRAPKDSSRNFIALTEEQKEARRKIIGEADRKRKEYAAGFYQKEKAETLAARFEHPEEVRALLKSAEGNFPEVYDFLSMDFGEENRELPIKMLRSLMKKDLRDVRAAVLAEHLREALPYRKNFPDNLFVPYILCPRVYLEQLSEYRTFLSELFDEPTADSFRADPKNVWAYVSKYQVSPDRQSERLTATPVCVVRTGQGGELDRKVLFTAICRTLGIPARLNPVDMVPQYYRDGAFRDAQEKEKNEEEAKVTLLGGGEKWAYLHNWTLAVLNHGGYRTLDLTDAAWADGKLALNLKPGAYRLLTSSRTPNGNQFAKKYCFRLSAGDEKELSIELCKTEISDLIQDIPLPPFQIDNDQNEAVPADSVIGGGTALVVWLEEGREPTEHILNEFMEAKDALNAADCRILFLIRDGAAWKNATFIKAKEAIPAALVRRADFSETAVPMARRMFVDPDKLPLAIVARGGRGVYASSGYNVGIADLLLKMIEAANKQV